MRGQSSSLRARGARGVGQDAPTILNMAASVMYDVKMMNQNVNWERREGCRQPRVGKSGEEGGRRHAQSIGRPS